MARQAQGRGGKRRAKNKRKKKRGKALNTVTAESFVSRAALMSATAHNNAPPRRKTKGANAGDDMRHIQAVFGVTAEQIMEGLPQVVEKRSGV